ncbi:MAG: DnaJ domain-containing protein [Alphaproteobacteria bacterium]|nr:DnaJ domain-containing protein [Alphaproteobacteria bacterium]
MSRRPLRAFSALRKLDPEPARRACDVPGCAEPGEYRAPRARDKLDQHYWFCLEHVRQYNAAWDYYAGMSIDEIEAHRRADQTWRRPSWPLGGQKNGKTIRFDLFDGMGILDDVEIPGANRVNGADRTKSGRKDSGAGRAHQAIAEAARRALAVLDLDPPVDFATIKLRYKELVKRHHPDANGGDKSAEERLKVINEAFTLLKGFYLPQASPAG